MSTGSIFLPTDQSSSSLLILLTLPHHRQRPPSSIFTTLLQSPPPHRVLVCRCRRRWDSNAEDFYSSNFNFNFDPNKKIENDEDNEGDDSPSEVDQWLDVLEELIDGIYIYKAFKSIGWISPVIIVSWLVATGPKAFLMASSLSLGQSVVSLLFRKLSGKKWNNPKNNAKTKKKPRTRAAVNIARKKREERKATGKKKKGYGSWVPGNDVPVNKDGQSSSNFGGWDELDKQTEINMRSDSSSQAASRAQRRQPIEKDPGTSGVAVH